MIHTLKIGINGRIVIGRLCVFQVADVMSKWEKYRSAGGTLSKQSRHHMFLFKKHLFLDEYIDLDDAVEKELLYYQVRLIDWRRLIIM